MTDRPRVTQILSDLGFARYFGTHERAMALGRAVHKAIHYDCKGTLDRTTLHPDLVGPLAAYGKLKAGAGLVIEASEFEVIHPTWSYIGHPDAIGVMRANGHAPRRVLLDWKVSESPDLKTAQLQLAAYQFAYDALHPGAGIEACFVGRLGTDGTYSLHDLTSSDAIQTWQACVIVWRALQERHRV